MFRDITIGKYYNSNSCIHSLDPRTKLFALLVYIISIFIIKNPIIFLPVIIVTLVLYRVAKIPFKYLTKGLSGIIILLLFTFFFRLVITPGNVVFSFWKFEITDNGIVVAIRLTLRIALMITGASLLSYTSTPRELSDGLEKSLGILKKIKVPINEMAIMTMIAFRFIPIMIDEVNIIMDAQASRGVEFEHVGIVKKCKNTFAIVVPLFLSTLRKSSDLAMAMEARGYKGDGMTSKMNPLVYTAQDKYAYLFILLYFIFMVIINIIIKNMV